MSNGEGITGRGRTLSSMKERLAELRARTNAHTTSSLEEPPKERITPPIDPSYDTHIQMESPVNAHEPIDVGGIPIPTPPPPRVPSHTDVPTAPATSNRASWRAALRNTLARIGISNKPILPKPVRGPRDLVELKNLDLKKFAAREAALWSIVGEHANRKLHGEEAAGELDKAIDTIRNVLITRNKAHIEALYDKLTS